MNTRVLFVAKYVWVPNLSFTLLDGQEIVVLTTNLSQDLTKFMAGQATLVYKII